MRNISLRMINLHWKHMISRIKCALIATLLLSSGAAHSDVLYAFSFTNLSGSATEDFNISLRYADYVQVTGMNQLPLVSTSTVASLGYAISHAGTNTLGWWGFDSTGNAIMDDMFYSYAGPSFLFLPTDYRTSYLSSPGTYGGTVGGNAPISFNGTATLTISEVPEPGSLALLLIGGVAALALSRRRKV
jgi:hypothetical protein